METQVLTSNGTVQSGNVSAEYMATMTSRKTNIRLSLT